MGDDATSAKSAPFSPRRSRPVERGEKPITANQCGRTPRWQCRLGYLSAGVECTYGELPNFGKRRRVGRVFSDLYPVAFFHADGRETERGREVGRRCYFDARRADSVALVIFRRIWPAIRKEKELARNPRTHRRLGGSLRILRRGLFPTRAEWTPRAPE